MVGSKLRLQKILIEGPSYSWLAFALNVAYIKVDLYSEVSHWFIMCLHSHHHNNFSLHKFETSEGLFDLCLKSKGLEHLLITLDVLMGHIKWSEYDNVVC